MHAVCEHSSCITAARALDLTIFNLQELSPLLAAQAIVVPVNNWLEPNVGDGKQQVRQHPVDLLSVRPRMSEALFHAEHLMHLCIRALHRCLAWC